MSKFNPFNPNSVVVPNLFAGRYKQVRSICSKLERLSMGMGANFFFFFPFPSGEALYATEWYQEQGGILKT